MTHRRRPHSRNGFTLVEVLATLVLIAIVLPVALHGVSVALGTASTAKRQGEAATLAQTRLDEIVVFGEWETAGSGTGDFGPDWRDYTWRSEVTTFDYETSHVTVTVAWQERGRERTLSLSTLVYLTPGTSSGSATAGSPTSASGGTSGGLR